jgi:hypothetical protein
MKRRYFPSITLPIRTFLKIIASLKILVTEKDPIQLVKTLKVSLPEDWICSADALLEKRLAGEETFKV